MSHISFKKTQALSSLVYDYAFEADKLKDFFTAEASIANILQVETKRSKVNREVLVQVLKEQNTSKHPNVIANIDILKEKNSYTITTGHQICAFTGPLYFIYKILSTIKLCQELKKENPTNNYVPVYWMATEDHDKEEINHLYLFNKKLTWDTNQEGAVGRFNLNGIENLINEIKNEFREFPREFNLFTEAYTSSSNLTEATRKLVDALFESYGLILIDADHAAFKQLAIPIFEKELIEQKSSQLVAQTNEKLIQKGYKTQVNPREINLFYVKDNLRERIVYEEDVFKVLHSSFSFSKEEMLEELHEHPERFSPNVITRPLYQEILLPNLATIGGPGETAYWLQLKSTFDDYQIPFPILVLRNSVLLVRHSVQKKIDKLSIAIEDIFLDEDVLIKQYIKENANISFSEEIQRLEEVFTLAKNKAVAIDFSLEKTVLAELTKAQNAIEMIQSKTVKAEKRNNETAVSQIQSIKESLFPNGILQERRDNILNYYSPELIPILLEAIEPLSNGINIIHI